MSDIKRPIMRYHGGKWKLAPWIIAHFPPHRIYVESFGGGASVLLRKPRCHSEVYNDLSGDVVNIFRVLRNPESAQRLMHMVRLTPYSREEFEQAHVACEEPIERARRALVRSFMGVGTAAIYRRSGFKANANNVNVVPAKEWQNYPASIAAYIERLQGVAIEHRPAIQIMQQQDRPDCLHYVDPPYVGITRYRSGDDCYEYEMTDAQHEELAGVLHGLVGMVVLSGYPCDLYAQMYSGWQRIEKAAHADGAKDRTEVLWLNPAAATRQQQRMEVAA